MRFYHPNHHASLTMAIRGNVLIYVSDEAHRGPCVSTELHHLFLTPVIVDVEVLELMKAAGVTYP